jgi:hypothetical protein
VADEVDTQRHANLLPRNTVLRTDLANMVVFFYANAVERSTNPRRFGCLLNNETQPSETLGLASPTGSTEQAAGCRRCTSIITGIVPVLRYASSEHVFAICAAARKGTCSAAHASEGVGASSENWSGDRQSRRKWNCSAPQGCRKRRGQYTGAYISPHGAEKEKVLKASLLTQQDSHRASTSGGGAWKEVPDVVSGRPYYWNTITNETAWEQPEGFVASAVDTLTVNSSSHVDTLPDGWVEKMHPATKQKYYFHQSSGKSSNQHPSTVSVPTAASTSAHANPQPGHGSATANSASNKRNRIEEVDPLDYTGGQVSRWITELCESYHHIRNDVDIILQGGKRSARDGAMADSTASGPLWQQR